MENLFWKRHPAPARIRSANNLTCNGIIPSAGAGLFLFVVWQLDKAGIDETNARHMAAGADHQTGFTNQKRGANGLEILMLVQDEIAAAAATWQRMGKRDGGHAAPFVDR